jgi:hypothetical protein
VGVGNAWLSKPTTLQLLAYWKLAKISPMSGFLKPSRQPPSMLAVVGWGNIPDAGRNRSVGPVLARRKVKMWRWQRAFCQVAGFKIQSQIDLSQVAFPSFPGNEPRLSLIRTIHFYLES